MPDINGVKYACEPCMRGHRSSKCTHSDRILLRVRKPGRPLSSCPHSGGDCNCGGVRVAIPKVSTCACGPSTSGAPENTNVRSLPAGYICGHQEQQLPVLLPSPGISQSGRIQKSKRRRSNSVSSSVAEALNGEQKDGPYNSIVLSKTQDQLSSSKMNGPLRPPPPPSGSIQPDAGTFPSMPHNLSSNQSSLSTNSSRGPSIDSPAATRPLSRSSPEAEASPNQMSSHSSPTVDEQEQEQKLRQQVGTESCGIIRTDMQEDLRRYEHSGFDKRMGSLQTDQKRDDRRCVSVPNGSRPSIQPPEHLARSPYCVGSRSQRYTPYHGDPVTLQFTPQQYNINNSQVPIQTQNLQQMACHPGVFPFFPYQQPVFQQPPTTTIYSSPPQYSTFQNIPTPQELAFLRSNAHLFAQSVSQPVPTPHFGEVVPTSAGSIPMTAHNCGCGSGCDCLGCAVHPYNNRTMNFVRSVRDIMGAEIGQNVSRGYIQAHGGGQPPTALAPIRSGGCCSSGSNSIQLQETSQPCVGLCNTIAELSPQTVTWPPLPSPKESSATAVAPRSSTSLASQPSWPKVGESDIENDEEESISPSAYFHVDYTIRGCTEEIDGCLCGEGCTCVGCLTHGGHDGVELAGFPTNMGGGLITNDAGGRATQGSDPTKQFDSGAEGAIPFTFTPSVMNGF